MRALLQAWTVSSKRPDLLHAMGLREIEQNGQDCAVRWIPASGKWAPLWFT
jgi:hypothetical protein